MGYFHFHFLFYKSLVTSLDFISTSGFLEQYKQYNMQNLDTKVLVFFGREVFFSLAVFVFMLLCFQTKRGVFCASVPTMDSTLGT